MLSPEARGQARDVHRRSSSSSSSRSSASSSSGWCTSCRRRSRTSGTIRSSRRFARCACCRSSSAGCCGRSPGCGRTRNRWCYKLAYGTDKRPDYYKEHGLGAATPPSTSTNVGALEGHGARRRTEASAPTSARADREPGPVMEIILLGIYSFFVWLIFIKLKLLPWTTPWKVAVAIIPVVALPSLLLLLNIFAPSTSDVRVIKYVVPVVAQVRGRVIEVPVENNRPVKKGDVLFRIDPTPYQNEVRSLEARLVVGRGEGRRRAHAGRARAQARLADARLGANAAARTTERRPPARSHADVHRSRWRESASQQNTRARRSRRRQPLRSRTGARPSSTSSPRRWPRRVPPNSRCRRKTRRAASTVSWQRSRRSGADRDGARAGEGRRRRRSRRRARSSTTRGGT